MSGPPARRPQFLQLYQHDDDALKSELAQGLMEARATLAPKFLYDALGSRLFDAITELDEYYPTRTEAAIFLQHAGAMAASLGQGLTLVDLGAGNGAKAARLFSVLRPRRYVAVDISVDFLRQALDGLQRSHADVEMIGVGMDFSSRLELPPEVGEGPRVVFYPGSSIGNFSPPQAEEFLARAHRESRGGHLLIGVDLVKDERWLVPAYDDVLGVTAAFNLNLLRHVNTRLGSDFDVRDWRHVALYDAQLSRIEMHLEARHWLRVHWRDGERSFVPGERIHTENSYKWSPEGFAALLRRAGFGVLRRWTDERGWFGVWLAGA